MNFRWRALIASLLAASFTATFLLAADSSKTTKKDDLLAWGDSPEAYLLTAQERIGWSTVSSEKQAEQFIASYWTRHGEPFHQEILKRIEAADKLFALGERRGSETERGRVFMILGAPTREISQRNENVPSSPSGGGRLNSIELRALGTVTWIYKPDRLPPELGVPELTITFHIDVNHGIDDFENPGLIVPYLTRAAEHIVTKYDALANNPPATAREAAETDVARNRVPTDEAVWNAGNELNGTILSGDSYLSATETPFYAISFYLPKRELSPPDEVIVAAVIRDATGVQVATTRTTAKPAQYDASGDRFVDAAFALPAGHYTGAFALASTDGKLLASARREFDVLPIEHAGLRGMLMTSHIDTLETQQAFDPFTFLAMKYAVKGDRHFHAGDKIGCFTVLDNPSVPQPSVVMKLQISRNGKVVQSSSWAPVQLSQAGPRSHLLAIQFDPNTFTPGDYSIQLQLREMSADKLSDAYTKGYQTRTDFVVVQ